MSLGKKGVDVLFYDVIKEPLSQIRMHRALEGERDSKVQLAALLIGAVRQVFKLPHCFEVMKELHVCADCCHQIWLEQDHVRVVGFSKYGWKAND